MIKKAVITAAGKGTRQYPATNAVQKELFPLVDRDGITKPTIQIIAEEALRSGIEEIAIVVQAGEEEQFKKHFRPLSDHETIAFKNKQWGLKESDTLARLEQAIVYLPQTEQKGYGHAVYCARDWVGDEPFLLMLGDHVYVSETDDSCVTQLKQGYERFGKSIYSVKHTPAERIYLFGTVAGSQIKGHPDAVELTTVKEKPDVAYARQYLQIPGLPRDTFLSFFGLHILTPTIFDILQEHIENDIRDSGEIQLTTAQAELCTREGAVGLAIQGKRLDMGTPLGYLETQISLAMNGVFSPEIDRLCQEESLDTN